MCAVQGGAFELHPVKGGLDDHILLGMEASAEFVPFTRGNALLAADTADVSAVGDPGRRSVVPRSQNPSIEHSHSSDMTPDT